MRLTATVRHGQTQYFSNGRPLDPREADTLGLAWDLAIAPLRYRRLQ